MRAGVTMSSAIRGLALVLLAVAGCANAGNPGSGGGGDDAPGKVDASVKHDSSVAPIDSPPPIDSPGPVDAAVDSPMIDSPSGGPFCSSNSQCTTSGECCVTLGGPMGFCAPGQVIAGQCFPQ